MCAGVVYMSHIPPMMKPNKIRSLLNKKGAEILRIYLAPEDTAVATRRKEAGGKRGKRFTEGCVHISFFILFFWFTFIPAPPITDCSRARGQ